jgi:hypothetical protein
MLARLNDDFNLAECSTILVLFTTLSFLMIFRSVKCILNHNSVLHSCS